MTSASIFFYSFQAINGLSSASLFLAPKQSHESLFQEPQRAYDQLGFSPTAAEMLHNVLRGQAAALLSISTYLYSRGPKKADSFLLIGIAGAFTFVSQILTARHHVRNPQVMEALGSIKGIYPLLGLNLAFAAGGAWFYRRLL
ncbi:hypothetical protein TWF481_012069 [Arthrobotrys musiformis]|uniref:Uncharacterized protein n=1 Tax=Arthrobotrys musiformis TaxID=47236 RepID=A0AAV9VW12_9PEZI